MSDSELDSEGFEAERKERKSRKSKVSKRSKCRRKVSSASLGQGSSNVKIWPARGPFVRIGFS